MESLAEVEHNQDTIVTIINKLEDLDIDAAKETLETAFGSELVPWYFDELRHTFEYAVVIANENGLGYNALALVEETSTGYGYLSKIATHPSHQRNGHFNLLMKEVAKNSPQGYFLRSKQGSDSSEIYRRNHDSLFTNQIESGHFGRVFVYDVFGRNVNDIALVMGYMDNKPPTITKPN